MYSKTRQTVFLRLSGEDMEDIEDGGRVVKTCPFTGKDIVFAFKEQLMDGEYTGDEVVTPSVDERIINRLRKGGTAVYTSAWGETEHALVLRANRQATRDNRWL